MFNGRTGVGLKTLQPMLRFNIVRRIKVYEELIKHYYYVKTCKSVSALMCFKSPTVFC